MKCVKPWDLVITVAALPDRGRFVTRACSGCLSGTGSRGADVCRVAGSGQCLLMGRRKGRQLSFHVVGLRHQFRVSRRDCLIANLGDLSLPLTSRYCDHGSEINIARNRAGHSKC